MADKSFRLRFAPSPTGYLHVGGARTALYNWLYARQLNGTFILRIEDTDVQRSSEEMVQIILNSLEWLGLKWDEGPFFQSQRLTMYKQAALQLVERRKAYRCFCKPEDLNARREAGMKATGAWKYERICLSLRPEEIEIRLASGEPHAIRFFVPSGRTAFQDLVHGEISLDHGSIDDFVLLRSDGYPTYHLSVVVDDIDMKITHVIRGDDHISNTPKQILLYDAFDSTPPLFGHLPLILGPDKKRLSKRHGAVAVEEYRNQGILPEALVNFLALLGWNPGDEREIFSLEELTKEFDLARVGSSNAVFDFKKLQWMNGRYMSSLSLERILEAAGPYLQNKEWSKDPEFAQRVDLMRTRSVTLVELIQMLEPFYREDFSYDTKGLEKTRKEPGLKPLLEEFMYRLSQLPDWQVATLEAYLRSFTETKRIKAAVLIHPVRLAVSGKTSGPGLFELLHSMGQAGTIRRLERFLSEL
ncbi:glutamate--tRNA ligase [bacterium]|nr:glutamate--tRNA ligase [bacterium]MCI0605905.1 glutamate--tRNA ligase [bacterium]